MLPQLVLNEDEKKRRFQKFLSKKYGEGSNLVEDHQYSDDDLMHQRVTDITEVFESPENDENSIQETTTNHETSFEPDLLDAQSLRWPNYLHSTLVAEALRPDESVTVEDVVVHQQGEKQPNLEVILKRSRPREAR